VEQRIVRSTPKFRTAAWHRMGARCARERGQEACDAARYREPRAILRRLRETDGR